MIILNFIFIFLLGGCQLATPNVPIHDRSIAPLIFPMHLDAKIFDLHASADAESSALQLSQSPKPNCTIEPTASDNKLAFAIVEACFCQMQQSTEFQALPAAHEDPTDLTKLAQTVLGARLKTVNTAHLTSLKTSEDERPMYALHFDLQLSDGSTYAIHMVHSPMSDDNWENYAGKFWSVISNDTYEPYRLYAAITYERQNPELRSTLMQARIHKDLAGDAISNGQINFATRRYLPTTLQEKFFQAMSMVSYRANIQSGQAEIKLLPIMDACYHQSVTPDCNKPAFSSLHAQRLSDTTENEILDIEVE